MVETRWPCPTCLGATMEKTTLAGRDGLTVDHCPRCGGVWFELGEIQRLRGRSADELWSAIPKRSAPQPARCHSCHALVDRDVPSCPACGERVVLDCPTCARPLESARHGELTLDVCRKCQGVWFDHHELSAIWTLELNQAVARRARDGVDDVSDVLLHSLVFAPDLLFYGAYGAAQALGAAGEAVASGGGEAVGGVIEVVGSAAESAFELIAEIIGGIFS